jgi:short-subunit dehydrogenase
MGKLNHTLNTRQGPVAIIGGTSALGRALAIEWLKRGRSIILCGRDATSLEACAQDLRVRTGGEIHIAPSLDWLTNQCKTIVTEITEKYNPVGWVITAGILTP